MTINNNYFYRLETGESYFDTLPPDVEDGDVQYSTACLCLRRGENEAIECKSVFEAAFPTLFRNNMDQMSPRDLCDREKRELDADYSDDPTEEDFQLFKQTPQLRPRVRREVPDVPLSKENATRYCAARISETDIGKLCTKVGVNVQELVNTCSRDLEVSEFLLHAPFFL